MIKNGRYYSPPPEADSDFKELFRQMSVMGVGMQVDDKGNPIGHWTPALFTDRISEIQRNSSAIELRTVQNWFQDNQKGPNVENLHLIAKVFGCDDPKSTMEWSRKLIRSKKTGFNRPVFAANVVVNNNISDGVIVDGLRHDARKTSTDRTPRQQQPQDKYAAKCASIFCGQSGFNLIVFMWGFYIANGLLNFSLGLHSVTYSPSEQIDKQVGLIWAPTWTILPAIILPVFILIAGQLISFWTNQTGSDTDNEGNDRNWKIRWMQRVEGYSFSFWTILIVCVFFVFGFQWVDVSKKILAGEVTSLTQIDRNLISLIRPEIISEVPAILAAMMGYMFTGFYVWTFLTVLLLIHILATDFTDLNAAQPQTNHEALNIAHQQASIIMSGIFRCSVLALWIATAIKIQVAYLSSDSPNIYEWITHDFLRAIGMEQSIINPLAQSSITHLTTFLMVLIVCVVFFSALISINGTFRHSYSTVVKTPCRELDNRLSMTFVIGLTSLNILLVGQFSGFSVLLLMSAFVSIYSIYNPQLKKG